MSDAHPNRFAASARNFWLELKLSAFNLGYYRHLRRAPVGGGVRYFLTLHLFLAALYALTFAPDLVALPGLAARFVTVKLPAEFAFELKGGRLATNLPDNWAVEEGGYTFVVSTLAGTAAPVRSERNWVVVGPDAVFIHDEDMGTRVNPLKGYPDMRYDRPRMLEWIGTALPWWLALVGVLSLVGVWGWLALVHATGVMAFSWVALAVGRLYGLRLTFAQWQNLGWRLATTPALVSLALLLAGASLPMTFAIVYLMFIMAVIADEKADPALS